MEAGSFRVERSFAVDHPQVAAHERDGEYHLVAEPFARQRVAQRQLLQAEVRGRIGVVLRKSRLRTDSLIPFLGIDHLTAVDQHAARTARGCRKLPRRRTGPCWPA